MSASTTCHNCGSGMYGDTGFSAAFACPGCEFIADADGVQRQFFTGRPCPCAFCQERLAAAARLAQTPPPLKLLGQVFAALARAGAERKRRAH